MKTLHSAISYSPTLYIFPQEGEAEVTCDRGSGTMTPGTCLLVAAGEK